MAAIISDLQIEKERLTTIRPRHSTRRHSLFLSNLDQQCMAFILKFVHFFSFPVEISFDTMVQEFMEPLPRLFDAYDFMYGRLAYNSHQQRFEIDCNAQGLPFAVATSHLSLQSLGDITSPNPAFSQLFHLPGPQQEEYHLISIQLTGFQSGGMAVGWAINHCLMDGFALQELARNFTHLLITGDLAVKPMIDRTPLKARHPLQIKHHHHEFSHPSTPMSKYSPFLPRKSKRDAWFNKMALYHPSDKHVFRLFTLSAEMVRLLKLKAMEGGVQHCTNFVAVLAHLWRARSAAMTNKKPEDVSTLLFVVDIRSKVDPPLPREYAGNGVMMAYAKATWRELQELPFSEVVKKLQESAERINEEYVRSAIDWLELHDGVTSLDENGFLVSSWSHMGFTNMELASGVRSLFGGPVVCANSVNIGLILSSPDENSGRQILIGLEPPHMARFENLIQTLDLHNSTSKL